MKDFSLNPVQLFKKGAQYRSKTELTLQWCCRICVSYLKYSQVELRGRSLGESLFKDGQMLVAGGYSFSKT